MKTKQEIREVIDLLSKSKNNPENRGYGKVAVELKVRIDVKIRALEWVLSED